MAAIEIWESFEWLDFGSNRQDGNANGWNGRKITHFIRKMWAWQRGKSYWLKKLFKNTQFTQQHFTNCLRNTRYKIETLGKNQWKWWGHCWPCVPETTSFSLSLSSQSTSTHNPKSHQNIDGSNSYSIRRTSHCQFFLESKRMFWKNFWTSCPADDKFFYAKLQAHFKRLITVAGLSWKVIIRPNRRKYKARAQSQWIANRWWVKNLHKDRQQKNPATNW